MQIITVYFPLQVKKNPHDTVANLVFTPELGVVTNILFSDNTDKNRSRRR